MHYHDAAILEAINNRSSTIYLRAIKHACERLARADFNFGTSVFRSPIDAFLLATMAHKKGFYKDVLAIYAHLNRILDNLLNMPR